MSDGRDPRCNNNGDRICTTVTTPTTLPLLWDGRLVDAIGSNTSLCLDVVRLISEYVPQLPRWSPELSGGLAVCDHYKADLRDYHGPWGTLVSAIPLSQAEWEWDLIIRPSSRSSHTELLVGIADPSMVSAIAPYFRPANGHRSVTCSTESILHLRIFFHNNEDGIRIHMELEQDKINVMRVWVGSGNSQCIEFPDYVNNWRVFVAGYQVTVLAAHFDRTADKDPISWPRHPSPSAPSSTRCCPGLRSVPSGTMDVDF